MAAPCTSSLPTTKNRMQGEKATPHLSRRFPWPVKEAAGEAARMSQTETRPPLSTEAQATKLYASGGRPLRRKEGGGGERKKRKQH